MDYTNLNDDSYDPPATWESHTIRLIKRALQHDIRLCCICLRGHRRCYDSRRWHNLTKSWKHYRRTRWK